MRFFELDSADISALSAGDLRELVARLSEALRLPGQEAHHG